MLPGDRLITAFTQPVTVGQEFREWLLHVTIVPWFRTDISSEKIAAELNGRLSAVAPFEARLGKPEQFGHNRGKSANLIEQPTPFLEVERIVRQYLRQQDAWMVDATTKTQRPFVPHITTQRSAAMQAGEVFYCSSIYIVEQLGVSKKVVAAIDLAR